MKKTKLITLALFIFYLYAVIKIILFKFRWRDMSFLWLQLQRDLGHPADLIYQLQKGNFIPFKTIFINIQSLSGLHDLINFVGNIAAFLPFGIFLVLLFKNKFIRVLALTLSFSLCLECLQVVFSLGIFDVDDLLLNTFGGLLGFCAIKLFDRFTVQDRDTVGNRKFNNADRGNVSRE